MFKLSFRIILISIPSYLQVSHSLYVQVLSLFNLFIILHSIITAPITGTVRSTLNRHAKRFKEFADGNFEPKSRTCKLSCLMLQLDTNVVMHVL